MKRKYRVRLFYAAPVFLLVCVWLVSCAGVGDSRSSASYNNEIRTYLSSSPDGTKPVFIGFAPRLRSRDEEESVAIADAAVKVARYLRLSGAAAFSASTNGSFSTAIISYSIDDDPDSAAAIAPELVITKAIKTDSGTVVRCVYPGAPAMTIGDLPTRDIAGRPTWLEKVPEISGYITGVGTSARSRLLAETFAAADDSALWEVLSQIALFVDSSTGALTGAAGTITRRENRQIAEGTLTGYYILDRWISDDGKTYYSLAVSPL